LAGPDRDEPHRGAAPLELLYDLVFVVAFGQAANELTRFVAEGSHRRSTMTTRLPPGHLFSWAWQGARSWRR
jgi:low temperature requirement protein LtrA